MHVWKKQLNTISCPNCNARLIQFRFRFLDKVEGHLPFIILSFLIRIVEAMGNAAFLTASFAIIAKEFPDNVATTFVSSWWISYFYKFRQVDVQKRSVHEVKLKLDPNYALHRSKIASGIIKTALEHKIVTFCTFTGFTWNLLWLRTHCGPNGRRRLVRGKLNLWDLDFLKFKNIFIKSSFKMRRSSTKNMCCFSVGRLHHAVCRARLSAFPVSNNDSVCATGPRWTRCGQKTWWWVLPLYS